MSKKRTNAKTGLLALASLFSSTAGYAMFTQSGALVFEMLGLARDRFTPFWSALIGTFTAPFVSTMWLGVAWTLCILGLGFLYYARLRILQARALRCIACDHDLTGRITKPCPECGSKEHMSRGGAVGFGPRALGVVSGFIGFIFLAAALGPWCTGIYTGAIGRGELSLIVFVSTGNLFAAFLLISCLRALWVYSRQERLERSTPRCEHCGYNLTGNVTGRCPECGTPCPAPVGAGERT